MDMATIAQHRITQKALKGIAAYTMMPEYKQMAVTAGLAGVVGVGSNMFDGKDNTLLEAGKDFLVAGGIEMATDKVMERVGINYAGKIAEWVTPAAYKTTVADLVQRTMKSHARPLFTGGTSIGLVAGAVTGVMTGTEDSNTLVNAGLGAVAGYGIGALAEQYAEDTGEESLFKKITAKTIGNEERKINVEEMTQKLKARAIKGHNIATAGIAAVIGLGTLASVRNNLDHEQRTDLMKAEEEKQITRKENNSNAAISQMFGYNQRPDFGQMAIDMFNERIGHHKMGNAKFQ